MSTDIQALSLNVPTGLKRGVPMLKISSKKIKQVIIKLDEGSIQWSSRKGTKIPMSAIRELRLRQPPTESDSTPHASRWITVVYVTASQWRVLHMIALTDDIYTLWKDTLTRLVAETSDRVVSDASTPADPDMMWIRQLWPNGAKMIDYGTASGLCGGIGMVIPPEVAVKYNRSLDLTAFRQLIKEAQTRPELQTVYDKITRGSPFDRKLVSKFLAETQKIDCGRIFDKHCDDDIWTITSLTDFLLSSDNTQILQQDMTRPLPDYFISSSHNTYLVGEQWRGESTVEGYIRVLLAKCRCVEIDCHDGEMEPVASHRNTLTSSVPVRDICQAIDKYAFVTSPYPVIISAEVHCSFDQQFQLDTILRGVFGEKLVTEPMNDAAVLPSPEDLKYRILFKTKPPPIDPPTRQRLPSLSDSTTSSTESESGLARLARKLSIGSPSEKRPAFCPLLSDLLVYTAGVKYQGFSKLVTYEPRQQFSVSEKTGVRILKENKADWVKHNFTHLSRVYPKASRVDSTNYDPLPYWQAGCQIVALNSQTHDEATIMNHAMFADTPGYILKPPALRSKLIEPSQIYHIRIQIISAQRLPLSSDLFVEGRLGTQIRRTTTKQGTALNPIWDDSLKFTITTTPSMLSLTFLDLQIKNRQMLAQWVRPISQAPRGYHHLPLYDALLSRYVFATLFVRIDVDHV